MIQYIEIIKFIIGCYDQFSLGENKFDCIFSFGIRNDLKIVIKSEFISNLARTII